MSWPGRAGWRRASLPTPENMIRTGTLALARTQKRRNTPMRAQTHRYRHTDSDDDTQIQTHKRFCSFQLPVLPAAAGCVGMDPMDIDAAGSQHVDSLARVLTPEEESLASDGSGPMRGTKRPCESARLWERLCADRGVPIRCVSARTETQPPNDDDAPVGPPNDFLQHCNVYGAKWPQIKEILGKMEALVTEGQILSESIDMRIHRGGRELIDDIFEWSCDLEYLIEAVEMENYQAEDDGDEIKELQLEHDVYADTLAKLREAVDAAAVEAVDAAAVEAVRSTAVES